MRFLNFREQLSGGKLNWRRKLNLFKKYDSCHEKGIYIAVS